MEDTVFASDYKAKLYNPHSLKKLKPHKEEELSQAFEKIVSWCINGKVNELKEVLQNPSKPTNIYEDIIYSNSKDEQSGLNIREIVVSTSQIEVMKLIHEYRSINKYLYLGQALAKAINKKDLKMVQCILSRRDPKITSIEEHIPFDFEPQMYGIIKEIVTYMRMTKNKN